MKKRFLALLLAALMVVSLLPTVAFATEPVTPHIHGEGAKAVTFETAINNYSELEALFKNGGSGYLTANITVATMTDYKLTIANDVNLCLNDKVLNLNQKGHIVVSDGKKFQLYDCGTTEHTFGDSANVDGLWVWDDTLTGENIKHTVIGGVITGGEVPYFLDSQAGDSSERKYGGNLYLERGAIFNLYSGNLCGGYAQYGGCIFQFNTDGDPNHGIITMYDGMICGNVAVSWGGAMEKHAPDGFVMYGGSICYNKAHNGGGISNTYAMTIYGGNICNNVGGGIVGSGDVTMVGGNICNNTGDDGGIQVGKLTLGGTAVIRNNFMKNGTTACDVNSKVLTISSDIKPQKGMSVGIYYYNCTQFQVTNATATDLQYFVSNIKSLYVEYASAGAKLVLSLIPDYPSENHKITDIFSEGGVIYLDQQFAKENADVTFTVVPADGYRLKNNSLKVNGSESGITDKGNGVYLFKMPAAEAIITAEFELAPITEVNITIGTVSLDTVKGLGDGSRPTISVVDNSTATNLLNQNIGLWEAYLLDSKCNVLYGYNTGLLIPTDESWYSYNGTFAKTDYTNVKFDKVEKIGLVYCICGQNQDNYKLPATASDLTVKVNSVELPISTIEKSVSNNTNNFNIDGDRIYVCYVCDIIKSSPSYYIIVERNESNYSVATEPAKNGTVTVDKSSVAADGTVTITVAPDKGFVLDALTVLDANGKEVGVNNLGNNKYSFKMPKSNVSVKASFVKEQTVVNSFVDVKEGDYFYDAVLWAIENGITDGVDATHFNPSGITNRAQMVTFLWRAAGCPEPTLTKCPFADVESGSYYDKAVLWAYENGITGGTSATTFDPNANVNRAQVVTFLWRYSGGLSVDYWMQMSDVASGEYYSEAVRWALAEKITDGTSKTTFSPEDDCLRGQAVTFLYRGFGE